MDLTDDQIADIARLISHERLAAFVAITGTERDALALHHETMLLQGALAPVMGVIEIALRNAIGERLRGLFGVPDWLRAPPPGFEWRGEERDAVRRAVSHARRAAYAKMTAAEKKGLEALAFPHGVPEGLSHEDRVKRRQAAITVTVGPVIAQLTLFFWKRLFSADYEAKLWKRSLKRLFPDKDVDRAAVAWRLEVLYQARNRLAHHEPLHGPRLAKLIGAIDFIAAKFGTPGADGATALTRMVAPYRPALDRQVAALSAAMERYSMNGAGDVAPEPEAGDRE